MIFVTVGTHEQQFDRLIKKIDELKKDGFIKEEVFIQTGFSTYKPKYCKWSNLISYEDMDKYNKEANLIITHGGPASFLAPLSYGKIPIVVPRQVKYNEHVNDHQLEFVKEVEKKLKNIIVVEDEEKIKDSILNYSKKIKKLYKNNSFNNKKFCTQLKKEIEELFD